MLVIISLQSLNYALDIEVENSQNRVPKDLLSLQDQLDSLKLLAIEKKKPKIYPFNPNFISDYKGYQLGMSVEEIDRLHKYRSENKYVNSTKEFQNITKVSDSLLEEISPYFKFPEWVTKRRKIQFNKTITNFDHKVEKDSSILSTRDINKATHADFLYIDGIDDELAERIIKYRTRLKGYSFLDQLNEVWGLDKTITKEIIKVFSIPELPKIEKININTASFKEVLGIPYIDYELCVKIFDYRDEVAELQSITELKNIEGFPLDKYDRIVVYLHSQ